MICRILLTPMLAEATATNGDAGVIPYIPALRRDDTPAHRVMRLCYDILGEAPPRELHAFLGDRVRHRVDKDPLLVVRFPAFPTHQTLHH